MSLINDALKKAQSIQSRGPQGAGKFPAPAPAPSSVHAPAPSSAPAPTPGRTLASPPPVPARKSGPSPGLIIGVAACLLLGAIGGVGYIVYALLLQGEDTVTVTANSPVPSSQIESPMPASDATPSPSPEAAASAPVTTVPAATPDAATTPREPATHVATVAQPAAEPAPTTAAMTAGASSTTDPMESVVEPEVVEAPPPVRVNNPDPRIRAWVSQINVTGIRGGVKPRVLMNDRVFTIDEIVNHDFGLRVSKIGTRELQFEDPFGNTYDYRF